MPDAPTLTIKGIRDGLLVTCHQASWAEIVSLLNAHIEDRPTFFRGARLALDVGACEVRVAELSALRDSLSERGIHLWAVLSASPVTEATAQNLGLATRISRPRPLASSHEAKPIPAEAAKWLRGPLRSGMRVEHDGPVVVLGDVNPGAEIIAHGSVIVWGRLRGVVHAGAAGDETAVVCALDLSPTQLRIAGEIAVSPPRRTKPRPEVARLVNGRLIAEPWQEE